MSPSPSAASVGHGVAVFGARAPSRNVSADRVGVRLGVESVRGRTAGVVVEASAVSATVTLVSGFKAIALAAESTHSFIPVRVTRAMLSCVAASR
jgi:hypothetical protein